MKLKVAHKHILTWLMVFIIPGLLQWVASGDPLFIWYSSTFLLLLTCCALFYHCYFCSVPKYLFGGRTLRFAVDCFVMVISAMLIFGFSHTHLLKSDWHMDKTFAWVIISETFMLFVLTEVLALVVKTVVMYREFCRKHRDRLPLKSADGLHTINVVDFLKIFQEEQAKESKDI